VKKNCVVCDSEFEIVPLGQNRLSCGDECAEKRRNKQSKKWHRDTKVLIVKKCLYCDKTFNPQGRQKTCSSKECKKKLHKDQPSSNLTYRRKKYSHIDKLFDRSPSIADKGLGIVVNSLADTIKYLKIKTQQYRGKK